MSRRQPPPTVPRWNTKDIAAEVLGLPQGPPDATPPPGPGGTPTDFIAAVAGKDSPYLGVPRNRVLAHPVSDPVRPELLADFVGTLILYRAGKRLALRKNDETVKWAERGNLRWFFFGELVQTAAGSLAIGNFSIHPWPNEDTEPDTPFLGVTTELLRAIPTAWIISEAAATPVTRPRADGKGVERVPLSTRQRQRGRRPKASETRLIDYARRYLELNAEGLGRGIHTQLAAEFGLRDGTESREWARRAKKRELLAGAHPGRAGATPGPRLPIEEPEAKTTKPQRRRKDG